MTITKYYYFRYLGFIAAFAHKHIGKCFVYKGTMAVGYKPIYGKPLAALLFYLAY